MTTTMCLLPLVALVCFDLFPSTKSANGVSSYNLPVVVWSQQASSWSKLRGVTGDPQQWMQDNAGTYKYVRTQANSDALYWSVDYNPRTQELLWSDKTSSDIFRQRISSSADWMASSVPISNISSINNWEVNDIAVDWMTNNVYMTVGNLSIIVVVHFGVTQQGIHLVLHSEDLTLPTAICTDPSVGLLFWSDIGSQTAKIESSTLSGKNRTAIVKSGVWQPLGMTVDYTRKRLYWTDSFSRSIQSCQYDGSSVQILYRGLVGSGFRGVAIFQNFLFVTIEDSLEVSIHSAADGTKLNKIDVDAVPYYISVIKAASTDSHGCDTKGCQEFCLNEGNGRGVCACRQGYYLKMDGVSCETSQLQYIYSIGNYILSTAVDPAFYVKPRSNLSVVQNTFASNLSHAVSLGFHFSNNFLYYSDTTQGSISRINLNSQETFNLTVQQPHVEGMAVHWLDSLIFWSDYQLQHIMLAQLDGRYHTLFLENISQPRGLTLDPFNGVLYWSEADTKRLICKTYLNEISNINCFIEINNGSAQDLVVDVRTNRLYWSNPAMGSISWMNVRTNELHTAVITDRLIYGVTVFQDFLTWTGGSENLKFGEESTGRKINNIFFTMNGSTPIRHDQSYSVITYSSYLQPQLPVSSCSRSSRCQQICYSMSSYPTCGCAMGFKLNSNGFSCDSEVISESAIFFVDPYHKQIYQLHSNSVDLVQGFPLSMMDFPVSFETDGDKGMIYWIDSRKREIYSYDANVQTKKTLLSSSSGLNPKSLALNTATQKLYFLDFTQNSIFVINLQLPNPGQQMGKRRRRRNPSYQETIIVANQNPTAITIDQINGYLYWSEGSRIISVPFDAPSNRTVWQQFGNVTSLNIRPNESMLYIADKDRGTILSLNVSDGSVNLLHHVSSGEEICSVTTSQDFIFFTIWNKKGVYRIDRNATSNSNVTIVAPEIFARITDIKFVKKFIVKQKDVGNPVNVALIIGLTVGLFLLLLLLLLILLVCCCMKRKQKQKVPLAVSAPTTTSIVDMGNPEVEQEYMTLANAGIYAQCNPVYTEPTGAPEAGLVMLGGAVDSKSRTGMGRESIYENGNAANDNDEHPDVDNKHLSVISEDFENVDFSSDGINRSGFISPACDRTAAIDAVVFSKPRFLKRSDSDDFALKKQNKIATVVRRLARSLRTGEPDAPFKTTGDGANDARPSNDMVVSSLSDGRLNTIGAERGKPDNLTGRHMFVPPKLHNQPRGFAPASHNVPTHTKNTWGRTKMAQRSNSMK